MSKPVIGLPKAAPLRDRVWRVNRPAYNRGRYINPPWGGRSNLGYRWAEMFKVRILLERWGVCIV